MMNTDVLTRAWSDQDGLYFAIVSINRVTDGFELYVDHEYRETFEHYVDAIHAATAALTENHP
jgi:hypothetical protein